MTIKVGDSAIAKIANDRILMAIEKLRLIIDERELPYKDCQKIEKSLERILDYLDPPKCTCCGEDTGRNIYWHQDLLFSPPREIITAYMFCTKQCAHTYSNKTNMIFRCADGYPDIVPEKEAKE